MVVHRGASLHMMIFYVYIRHTILQLSNMQEHTHPLYVSFISVKISCDVTPSIKILSYCSHSNYSYSTWNCGMIPLKQIGAALRLGGENNQKIMTRVQQHLRQTERLIDGRTNGRTTSHSITTLCSASRGKNSNCLL